MDSYSNTTSPQAPLSTGRAPVVHRVNSLESTVDERFAKLEAENNHLRLRVQHLERELGTDFDSLPKVAEAPYPMSLAQSLPNRTIG